jgi:hypothetical protein
MDKEASIDFAPVAGEHVVVHAAASIHEDQNLGTASDSCHLRLGLAQAGQGDDRAEYGHRCQDAPQPACYLA